MMDERSRPFAQSRLETQPSSFSTQAQPRHPTHQPINTLNPTEKEVEDRSIENMTQAPKCSQSQLQSQPETTKGTQPSLFT